MGHAIVFIDKNNNFNMEESYDITTSNSIKLKECFNSLGEDILYLQDSFDIKNYFKNETKDNILLNCKDLKLICDLLLENKKINKQIDNISDIIEIIKQKSEQNFKIIITTE